MDGLFGNAPFFDRTVIVDLPRRRFGIVSRRPDCPRRRSAGGDGLTGVDALTPSIQGVEGGHAPGQSSPRLGETSVSGPRTA